MTRAQEPDDRTPGAPRPLTGPDAGPGAARVEGLDALLREIDSLRTTLSTDLSLAAGAVDAGAHDLAASLLASDRDDLARFQARALGHLRQLQDSERPAPHDVVVPFVPRAAVARRRRRLARLLPAAPLAAAAAALVGFLGVVPGSSGSGGATDVSGAVLSSWEELTRLSATDAPPEDVQRAARELNDDIAAMVARSGGDPAAAREALALLREAQTVLVSDDDAPQLLTVLAQSRALAARLLASLPPVAGTRAPSGRPAVADVLPLPTRSPSLAPRADQRRPAGASPRPTATTSTTTAPAASRAPASPAPASPAPGPSRSAASTSPDPRPTAPSVLPLTDEPL